ncbi:MAG TPA: hypothetical protein VMT18_14180 [Planctomycetota bacterium]|nr:hypothetical protein [Planctomycetota bacterium]
MSELEPLGGESNAAGQPQEGNRPAQNARLTTPGHLSNQGYQGAADADDFLGLGVEMDARGEAFELLADPAAEPAPEPSAWVETAPGRAFTGSQSAADFDVDADETDEASAEHGADEAEDADAEFSHGATYDSDEHPYGSWSESKSKGGGAGKLVAVAGLLVVGALGAVGVRFMGAAQPPSDGIGPVAVRPQAAPARSASVLAPVEDQASDARVGLEVSETTPADETGLAGFAGGGGLDAESARDAFEAERGDRPPVWFDPELDSQAEETETGWTEEAEAVTSASTFVGDPTALLALESGYEPTPEDETTEHVGDAPTDTQAVAAAEGEASSSSDANTDTATSTTSASGDENAVAALLTEAAPTAVEDAAPVGGEPAVPVVAASTPVADKAHEPLGAAVSGAAAIGPQAPEPSAHTLPVEGALAAHQESRASRTSTLAVEDVLLAPTMDSSNLRQANAKDLEGVWSETTVPMEILGHKTKVLTPNVGRVRVVLKSKDIFEGKLYAVGQGSVWLESAYGRISVDGKRIATVAQIDTKEGTPTLGSTGSQNLSGLEKVRVKTPGGTFYGKIIARDETQTTLITEDGARLTLNNGDVELLTDVPKVSIGGRVDDAKAKTDTTGKTGTKP